MPLKSGMKNAGKNIAEMHQSKVYKKVEQRLGKKRADKVAVAAGLSAARRMTKKKMGY